MKYNTGFTKRITVSVVRDEEYRKLLTNSESLLDYWDDVVTRHPGYDAEKEHLVVIMLNTRMAPVAWNLVSVGTVNETTAHPREVMRPVISCCATAFAIMHNHPSGDSSPSRADVRFTERIAKCAELFQIRLVDHVVVGEPAPGRNAYYSFHSAGLIP